MFSSPLTRWNHRRNTWLSEQRENAMKISALICVDQDVEYLALVVEQVHAFVDEIIIVDGPYRWIIEAYRNLPFDYSARTPNVLFRGKPLIADAKVKYIHREWVNEQEKRAFGYESCTSDLVLVIDSDELIEFDLQNLEYFIYSADTIARIDMYSLARSHTRAEYPVHMLQEIIANPDSPHTCMRLFRRNAVSATEHLPYLQIFNLPPAPPFPPINPDIVHNAPIGTVYHLSIMRTGESNFSKYRFYMAVNRILYNSTDPILAHGGWSDYTEMIKHLSVDDYTALLTRSGADPMRCSDIRVFSRFDKLPAHFKEKVAYADDVFSELGTHLEKPLPILAKQPIYFYLPESAYAGARCTFYFENARDFTILDHPVYYLSNNQKNYFALCGQAKWAQSFTVEVPPLEKSAERDLFTRLFVLIANSAGPGARITHVEVSP